jgi:hypothetical protein
MKEKRVGIALEPVKRISLCGRASFRNNLFRLFLLSFCCGQQAAIMR